MRPVLLLLLGLLALGFASECPRKIASPGREIVCYTSAQDVQQLKNTACRCTTLVHEGHDLQDLDLTRFATLRKAIKNLNPVLQFVVSISDTRGSLKTSATARQDGALRIVDILNEVDGVELNVTAGSKERLVHFVQTLKGEMKRKSKEKRLLVALPNKAEQLAKQFNIKSLSKYVDLFSLSTHYLMDDEERYRTFHPSRLMGQYDLVNTDKLVDLVHDLGADRRKILVSLPASGYKFTLKNAHENAPRDPTTQELPVEINRKDICDAVSQGPWTVERDDDSTAPYAFKDDTWIAFEDKISTGIKGKYVVLRNLAGLGIRNVENDVKSSCGKTITEEVYDSFTNNKRKSREAVLTSLKQDIYNTENLYPSNIKSSGFRISRIVDSDGKIHAVRENTQTEFSCPHQGYYVHPKSCNRFYRCVKFNQEVENYSIFEFDCPAGLAFDEQTSVCVWPGSLPEGSPCPGSPEIAPTTQQHFKCPGAGMFADPQNCRWFFACIEHDVHELRAYEFQCPYGLVFDEEKAICQWPWLVPACAGRSYEHGSAGGSGYGGGGYGKGGYGGGGEEHYGGKGEGGHGGDGGYGGGEGGDGGYGGDKNEGGYGGEGGHGGDKNEGGHAGGGEGGYGGDDKNEGGYSGGGKEGYGGDKNEGGYGGGEGGHGGDKNEGGYGGGGGYGGDKNEGGHAGGGGGRGYGGDKNEGGYGGVEGGYGGDKNEGGHAGGGEGGYGGDKNEGGYSGGGKEGYGGDKNEGGYGGVEGGYGGDKNEGGHGGGEEGGYGGDKNEGGYSEGESAHRQGGGDKSGGDKDTGHEGQGGSGGYDQSEGGYKGNSNSGQGGYEKGGEESEKREEESEGGDKNSAGSEKGEETETHDEGGAKTGGGSYDGQNQGGYDDKNTGGFNQGEYDEKEISGGSYDTKKGQDGGEDYNKNDGGYAEKGEDNSGGSEKPEGGYEGSDQGGYDGGYSGGPSKEDGGAPVPEPGIFEGDKKDESSAGSYGGDINGYGGGASEQGGGEVSYGKGSDSAGVDSGAKVEATGPTYDISPGGISTGNAAAPQSGQSILYSGYSPSPEAAHTAVSGGESLSGAGGQSAVIAGAPYTSVAGESHSIASGYYTDGSSNPNSFSTVSQRPLPTVYHDSGSAGGVTQSFGTVYTSGASGIANGGHLQSGYVEKYPQKPGYTVSNGVKTVYSGSTAPHASVYTTSSPGNGIYTHQSGASYSGGTDYSSNSAVSSGNQYYPTNPAVIYTNSGPGYTNAVPASGPDVGGYPAVVVADGSGFYTNQAGFPHNFGTSQVVPPFIPTSVTAPGNQYYPNQAGRPKKPTEVPLRPTAPSNGGYKTNEYHDNGGRGTIRYNNGVVTHKYAEDDVRDHNTAFRPFPAEEAVPETIQRTGPEYTRGGFTKTGPTKTGITTAQVGGSGTYVAGGPLRKTASGTDLIGENAFGTAPKKSAVIQQGSNVFTGAFGQSSSSRGPGPTVRPAGYAYSRPTPQFTGPATEASLNAGKKPSSEQFFNVHVYNTPTVLPSAPITAAPAVVNTYSYGRPTVGQRKDSGLSAGAASVEAHFNPQNRQPATARPPGTLDGYKSTLFEAARVPVAVSTPPPGIKTGFKVTSVTEMPIPGEIGGFDYDKYSYTHSEAGKGDGHLSIGVSLQQPTSYGFSRPSAVPVGPTGSSISSAKVGSSVSYQLPAQKEGGYEDSTRLDGGDYNYEATGGKFGEKISPAGGSASYQPVVTARPQIYKRPSSSTSTSIDSQSDVKKQSIGIKTSSKDTFNGYNYPRPTQKFSYTPETYSPVANVFPTTSTLPKITPTSTGVINNNRGNVKYTVSPYELPQNGNSAILSVETGGNKGYNYPPPPTQSSRPPGTYIKGGFTSSQPQIPQNGNSAILSVKTDANKGYNYPPPPTQSSRRPGTYIKGGFTSSQPQIPQNSAILSVETSGNKGYNYQSSSTKSFERPLNDIKGGFTPSEPVITTYSGKTSTPSYEIATKSEISKNRGKIIVKFSDLHPVLLGKLGAECTCKADPFATFRGDRPLLVDSSQGKVDLRNYDESDVYVDLDTNERETPRISGKVASQATKQAPSTYLPPTPRPRTTTTSLRVAASDIDASYSTRRSRSRGGKSLKDAKPALGGVDPDKIGVLELNPQGQAECARAGLFRHPKYCDKFYACHWDSVNNKFSLKIFNCPISLTFGSSVSACNWPTSGPTCQDDNILV